MSRIKLTLAATAAVATTLVASAAHAQPNVTLYGLIDTIISTVDNTNAAGACTTDFRVPWFSGSRRDLIGEGSLGGGTSTTFKLESEFEAPTDNVDIPDVLSSRDVWVDLLDESLGKLTFGRQNTITRNTSDIHDGPYGGASATLDKDGCTNVSNFKQLIFYAGSATGTRLNNGIVWKKLQDGRFFTGLTYRFGEVPGQFTQGTTESLTLDYSSGNFHLTGFVQQAKINDSTSRSYSVSGNVVFGTFRVSADCFRYTGEQPAVLGNRKDDVYVVSLKIAPQGASDYEVDCQTMRAGNAALSTDDNTLSAYANVVDTTATGNDRKNALYSPVFYHIFKRMESYVTADYMKLKDQYTMDGINGHNSRTEPIASIHTHFQASAWLELAALAHLVSKPVSIGAREIDVLIACVSIAGGRDTQDGGWAIIRRASISAEDE